MVPTAAKRTPGRKEPAAPEASRRTGKLAQLRLQPDDVEALDEVMRTLNLASTSEALREGLHLLAREAAEIRAAQAIRDFYGGEPAPLPDGVVPPSEEELREADEAEW
jgi:hypothetical protein